MRPPNSAAADLPSGSQLSSEWLHRTHKETMPADIGLIGLAVMGQVRAC